MVLTHLFNTLKRESRKRWISVLPSQTLRLSLASKLSKSTSAFTTSANALAASLTGTGHHRSLLIIIMFFVGASLPLLQGELFASDKLSVFTAGLTVLGLVALKWPTMIVRHALFCLCLRECLGLCLSLCLGLSWSTFMFNQQLHTLLPADYERVSIQVQGQVEGLPQVQGANVRFRFRINNGVGSEQQINELTVLRQQLVLLSCYRCPLTFSPNQHWRISVRLKRPNGYASWGAFDYEKYLFRNQIIAKGYVRTKESNTLLTHQRSLTLTDSFNAWRWNIKDELRRTLASESIGSSLIFALSIGDKSGLSNPQQQVLQRTGTSHLMAISGLHIGLVFMGLVWMLSWCSRPLAFMFNVVPRQRLVLLPSLTGAFVYAGLAGFSVSTQRAFTMLAVYVICRFIARQASLLRVLLIAIILILLVDPNSILDIGFWLSCSAVFIIAVVHQPRYQLNRLPDNSKSANSSTHNQRGGLENAFTDSSANSSKLSLIKLQPILWLGMLPLSASIFGYTSLLSPLVNLVAVPLFCVILIPATLVLVLVHQLGFASLAAPALVILQHIYAWVFSALEWVAGLSFSALPSVSLTHWTLFACISVGSVYLFNWRQRHWSWLLLGITVFMVEPLAHRQAMSKTALTVTLLDVGQGLSIVVEQPDYTLVYDTGAAYQTGFTAAQAVLIPYLHNRGLEQVDSLVISHADNDHIGGYETLLQTTRVGQVISSRVDKLPGAIECVSGQSWVQGDVHYEFISPSTNTPSGSNNRSCVLKISYGDVVVLITGDIEKQVERYLLTTNASVAADILLVPHQGSKTSSTSAFIDAVKPKLALVAAGYLNHYGHPHPNVVERYDKRGIEVLSTIDSGSISIEFTKSTGRTSWHVKRYRVLEKRFWHRRKMPKRTV